ncbi:BlaI/MecI/CopY family transcriptional regulator [Clostridioides sp. ES-S-0048-02]|uniref:BlaI/MecI/CopY family transcriptional regulator n=1 Tax=Clostridioides sp. ES-S-0048-02 TaxID=2770777 RepID=UPI001D10F323|nr:BlaI/MecI/CopY family transcriptional regulator [Clostridioides sp. ES-S-0048-02]
MSIQKIPKSELKIMKFIWKLNTDLSSKDVIKAMEYEYDWKSTTTLTLLSKLVKRGFLEADKINKITHYKILTTKKAYLQFATRQFLDTVHSGSMNSLIESLIHCTSSSNDTLNGNDINKF